MLTKERLNNLLKNTADVALKRRAGFVIQELDLKSGDNVLEVGCGDGYYLYILSRLGIKFNLTGVDIDRKALESAARNLRGKKVKLVYGDIMTKLPFTGSTFDKVIMSEVLEHLPNEVSGLREVKRILKKDGVLILTVPNANYPFLWDPLNWLLEKFFRTHIGSGFWAGIWNQHLRLYKPLHLQKVISKSGLRVMKMFPVTFWSLPFNHYLVNLGARILASKNSPRVFTQGANKFSESSQKSGPVKFFFIISNFFDSLNDFWTPPDLGVSIFAKVVK